MFLSWEMAKLTIWYISHSFPVLIQEINEGFVLDSGYDLKAELSHADRLASSGFMTKAKYSQCASACSRPRRNLDCPGILSLIPKNLNI